jgi:hypothetical protein
MMRDSKAKPPTHLRAQQWESWRGRGCVPLPLQRQPPPMSWRPPTRPHLLQVSQPPKSAKLGTKLLLHGPLGDAYQSIAVTEIAGERKKQFAWGQYHKWPTFSTASVCALLLNTAPFRLDVVAHVCNPSYLGDEDWEGVLPTWQKVSKTPSQHKSSMW